MKKLLIPLIAILFLLPACNFMQGVEDLYEDAKQSANNVAEEADKVIEDLKDKKDKVEGAIDEVKEVKEKVTEAADAISGLTE